MKIRDNGALGNALGFDYAVQILREQRGVGMKNGNIKDIAITIPIIVNCSFACELFFKAIIPKKTKRHLLYDDLFAKLELEDQNIISNSMLMIMRDQGKKNYSRQDFINDLKSNQDAFLQWRYFHEPEKIGIKFDEYFLGILQATLKGLLLGAT